jgi:hypothetical protein
MKVNQIIAIPMIIHNTADFGIFTYTGGGSSTVLSGFSKNRKSVSFITVIGVDKLKQLHYIITLPFGCKKVD